MSKRLEIVIDDTPIAGEDAAAYQDFGKVLAGHKASALKLTVLKWSLVGIAILGMSAAIWWWFPHSDGLEGISEVVLDQAPEPLVEEWEGVPPRPVVPIQQKNVVATPQNNTLVANTTATPLETLEPTGPQDRAEATPGMEDLQDAFQEGKVEAEQSVSLVFVQASPQIGLPALYDYLREAAQYPSQAMPDSVEGVVVVAFKIDTLGQPKEVRVVESLHPLLDHEATRVIRNMAPWHPATLGEEPVESRLSIPITFRIRQTP